MKIFCCWYWMVVAAAVLGWGVFGESRCRVTDIAVSQATASTSGIPRYRVEITNLCSECAVAKLHVHCGMFASANVVDPTLFKRIADDDCLVNSGSPLPFGKTISFMYSNTRPYPLSVASFEFLC